MNRQIIAILLVFLAMTLASCVPKDTAQSIDGDILSVDKGWLSFDGVTLGMSMSDAESVQLEKGRHSYMEDTLSYTAEDTSSGFGSLPVTGLEITGSNEDPGSVHYIVFGSEMPAVSADILSDKEKLTKEINDYFAEGRELYESWGDYLTTDIGECTYLDTTLGIPQMSIDTLAFSDGKLCKVSSRGDVKDEEYDCFIEVVYFVDEYDITDEYIASIPEGETVSPARIQFTICTTEVYREMLEIISE